MGWERRPIVHSGDSSIYTFVFTEVYADSGFIQYQYYSDTQDTIFDFVNPPIEGEEWTYQEFVDLNTGQWAFVIEGSGLTDYSGNHVLWMIPGTSVYYYSELYNWEDDMAGTVFEPCTMSDLSSERFGTGIGDGFTTLYQINDDLCWSDDSSLWHIERTSAMSLEFYDIYPNPLQN